MVAAQRLFISTSAVPLLLYYLRLSEPVPLFPATISWTIRKGVPRWTHHSLWLAGWAVFLSVFLKRGDVRLKIFALQMFATGFICVILCPIGRGGLQEKVHAVTAGVYMADHHVAFRILDVPAPHVFSFWAFFLAFGGLTRQARRILKEIVKDKGDEGPSLLQLPSSTRISDRNRLWYVELLRMLAENGLFLAFTLSMTLGVRRGAKALKRRP